MKMFPVRSSQISEVGHEARTGLMQVKFHSGQTYQYSRIPEETFKAMLMSDSVGSYFSRHIKGNENHPVHKIENQST